MGAIERPTFSSDASRQLYEYVERNGTVKRHKLLDVVSLPTDEFRDHLEGLKSDGYLEEDGGTLQISLEFGAITEYEIDDLSFLVRPGRQDDFDGLIETIRDVTAAETYVVAETIAEELLYEDSVSRHNAVKSRMFFVASVDGEVVGWTHLDLPQVEPMQGTAQQTVGVREAYRGNGIGTKLLARGIEWAEANGYRKVYNSVPITNDRALEFLTVHGWDTEAIRRDHYEIDGECVDEVMMAYEL
ncbi:GNAT family N-acetyltransferase [Natronorubrum daqingense]|uniref:GNAT family N-acetyltransferase n=1 Tax=Natronorubrum daqingense TaxID=588898 RepID=A0A1N6Z1W1_9EURY|nr:GNAT family N-acetyltransferase [Natronorubrum daqingense]APX95487.1 GNAT family N-acetyltransferase [Natronorubrum daqingense]SIR20834.1 L-amino acid N-acyltransferase YncA [Natronorubrum daqingense]